MESPVPTEPEAPKTPTLHDYSDAEIKVHYQETAGLLCLLEARVRYWREYLGTLNHELARRNLL